MALLVDTGVLYALADEDDDWHVPARDYLRRAREVLLVPVSVVPEVAYLLRARIGVAAEQAFVDSLARGELAIENLSPVDVQRSAALMRQYRAIGFVDASVVAVAERLRLRQIATTDRRHFAGIRPRHVQAFELVP
jgi:predicted nucleic acid-binding protein